MNSPTALPLSARAAPGPNRLERFVLVGMLAFAAAHAISSISVPFGWDHGIMAAVGDSFASGKLPYRDSWDLKGPFAYIPFALTELLFGKVMWGIRLFDLAILAPALYCVFRVVQAYTTTHLAAFAGLFLYLWLVSAGWFFTAQPDTWAAALSAIAICPLLHPDAVPRPAKYALAGVMIGCAGLIKPFYLALGLVPLTTVAISPALSMLGRARLALLLALAAGAPILLATAYFAAGGGLAKLVEVHLLFTSSTYSGSHASFSQFGSGVLKFLTQGPAPLMVPLAALGLFSIRGEKRLFAPMAVWLALAILLVFIQGKFYKYHWYPVFPALTILAAFKAHEFRNASSDAFSARAIALGASLLLVALTAWFPAKEIAKFALYNSDSYYKSFYHYSYRVSDQMRAAEHIRDHTRPDDPVFVFGIDATARYLSGRPDPTRFTFDMPLIMESALRTEYRAEAMAALTANPPAYIIYGIPWTFDKPGTLRAFPELDELLARDYALEQSYGIIDLYRRKDDAKG